MGWLACNCRWRQLPVASARVLPSAKPATIMMAGPGRHWARSEEHTSELQSLMRISYAVFCLKKKKTQKNDIYRNKKKCVHQENTQLDIAPVTGVHKISTTHLKNKDQHAIHS